MYILLKKNKDENVAKADFFETQLKQLKKERDDYLGLNKKQNNVNEHFFLKYLRRSLNTDLF